MGPKLSSSFYKQVEWAHRCTARSSLKERLVSPVVGSAVSRDPPAVSVFFNVTYIPGCLQR